MTISFEPEIGFPDDPYHAAFRYLAVMAYPDRNAGRAGRPGIKFADALAKFSLWACSKARGLPYIREQLGDPHFVAPKKREFVGPFERGMRRIDRRIAAYDLIGTQMLQGFFAVRALGAKAVHEGRAADAFHLHPAGGPSPARAELWDQGTPTIRKILAGAPDHWAEKLKLNHTGSPADRAQKLKDDYARAFKPSVPVLHMVHGFTECAERIGPSIDGWGERDPLTAMLLNANLWIWDAIDLAERWRQVIEYLPGLSLRADDMIKLAGRGSDSPEGTAAPNLLRNGD